MPVYGLSISDTATPALEALSSKAFARGLLPAVGAAGKRGLVDHFAEKQANPSSHRTAQGFGISPSGLFADFARSTSWREFPGSVMFSVNHVAARQRYEGGVIEPVNAEHLALPVRAEAVGKRPREWGDELEPVFGRNGVYGLALSRDVLRLRRSRKKVSKGLMLYAGVRGLERGMLMYLLVDRVEQAPDPSVLPDDKTFTDGIIAAVGEYVDDKLKGPTNG